jgi:redox-sensing transcriptional repressor
VNRKDDNQIPKAVVTRLSLYLRELQQFLRSGQETISSNKLGRTLGITGAQVRKDFAYFGQFGFPGIGYRCEHLTNEIKRILGTNRIWPVALIGCGNMGRALLGYKGFAKQGFQVLAAFDTNSDLVGSGIEGIPVNSLDDLTAVLTMKKIQLAILAVPTDSAQDVAEKLVKAGVIGILNFAPVTLNLPNRVAIVGVDLALELEQLSFSVAKKAVNERERNLSNRSKNAP